MNNSNCNSTLTEYRDDQQFQNISNKLNIFKSKIIHFKSQLNDDKEDRSYSEIPLSNVFFILNQSITEAHLLQMMIKNLLRSKFISNAFKRKYLYNKNTFFQSKIESLLEKQKINSLQNINLNQTYLTKHEDAIEKGLLLFETIEEKYKSNEITSHESNDKYLTYVSNIKKMISIKSFILREIHADFNQNPKLVTILKNNHFS